jgi:hypothetical protein
VSRSLLESKSPAADVTDEQQAMELLKSKGYRVLPPFKKPKLVTNSEVLDYFYFKLQEITSTSVLLVGLSPTAEDRKALRSYHSRAKKLGLKPQQANYELFKILKEFFKHYSRIGLQTPPGSLKWLLSPTGSWILKKAVLMSNSYSNAEYSEEFEQKLDKLCSDPSNEFVRQRDRRLQALTCQNTEDNSNS